MSSISVTINGTTRTVLNNINRLPFGPVNQWAYGNGLVRGLSYDKNYRVTNIATTGVQSLAYGYDANSNISNITHGITGSYTQTFGYDKLNRLTNITSTGLGNHTFTYDELGNRKTRSGALAETYAINSTSNRLSSVTRGSQTRVFSYDANGNITNEKRFNGSNFSYVYNNDNRMVKAGTTDYKYNALGQRVYKKVGSTETRFIYSPEGQLLAEGTTKQYIYFQGQVVGYILNNQLYYVHNDHLGRPEVITNQSKGVVWRAKLEAFDRTVLTTSIGEFNIGFPGQYWDAEKLSWYNYFRDYDATTGRYLQSDPIGLAGGLNTYVYALSNPAVFTDPFGLDVWSGLRDYTGGCSSGDFIDDVIDNYVDVMDSTGSQVTSAAVSFSLGGAINQRIGGTSFGSVLKPAWTDYRNGYKVDGIGSRSFGGAARDLIGSTVGKTVLIKGMYSSGVLVGSALRSGVNRLGASMTSEKCGCSE